MQHGSAVLVIHSVVLAGEGEEQLAARTIIAVIMEKNGHFHRELHSSQRSNVHPQGNHQTI